MRLIFHIILLILYIAVSNSSIISNAKSSLASYLKNTLKNLIDSMKGEDHQQESKEKSRFEIKHNDRDKGSRPKTIIKLIKNRADDEYFNRDGEVLKSPNIFPYKDVNSRMHRATDEPYRLDPVLNSLRKKNDLRRKSKGQSADDEDSDSSSVELRDWKKEWKEHWIKKKLEAINSTEPRGDVINMVAARPWGVPCGDPNQHDMPWGNCMLAIECDSEYRIYRGDYACGRTQFVCCAILNTNYDMNQPFDNSFEDSALTTDSEEKKHMGKGASEKKSKKSKKEKQRRKKEREKRKKKIKKNIQEIIKEIRKILNRQYTNATSQRNKKTKQLKKFISTLKKKYKQDRKAVKHIHEAEIVKVDEDLMDKLEEIRKLNRNFVKNSTFRDIILLGKISKTGARMLVQAYPELVPFFTDTSRKSGNAVKDYLDYDIEYGMLYY